MILEVQPALKLLMASLGGPMQIVARGEPLPAFDCQTPLQSLPLAFRTALEAIPVEVP